MNKVVLFVVVFIWSSIVVPNMANGDGSQETNVSKEIDNTFKLKNKTEVMIGPSTNNAGSAAPAASAGVEATTEGNLDADKAGQSLSSDKTVEEGLNELADAYGEALLGVQQGDMIITPVGHEEIMKFGFTDYIPNKKACVDRHKYAALACIEVFSSHMIDGAAALNSITALVGGMAVKDNCSKFAGAMDIASKALTAYTAACGAAKLLCGNTCQTADDGIEGMLNTEPTLNCKDIVKMPPVKTKTCAEITAAYSNAYKKIKKAAQEENKDSDKLSVSAKKGLCKEKYTQLAISAASGIASLAKSIMQGNKCKKDTEGAPDQQKIALPSLPATPPSAEKCADPAYGSLPECLCLKNPRTPGCSNAYQKPGESNARQLSADPGSRFKTNDRGIAGLPGGGGIPGIDPRNANGVDGGGSAVSGSSGGGGAGLGGGGGGSGGGGAPGAGEDGAGGGIDLSKYDTGFTGGGGGGGRWGGGSGSSKYRAYLPGGAKDPRKNLAGQQAWTKEVTGQGGKSNWEKVKDRYRDNKGTLLNN